MRLAQPYRTVKAYGQRVVPVLVTKLTRRGERSLPYHTASLQQQTFMLMGTCGCCHGCFIAVYEERPLNAVTNTVAMAFWKPPKEQTESGVVTSKHGSFAVKQVLCCFQRGTQALQLHAHRGAHVVS